MGKQPLVKQSRSKQNTYHHHRPHGKDDNETKTFHENCGITIIAPT